MNILKGVKDEIWVNVTAEINRDGGSVLKVSWSILSKKPRRPEQKEISVAISDGNIEDEALVREYLKDWKGLRGEDGEEVPFNEDSLAAVMDAPEYLAAVVRGILQAILGKDAIQKN